MRAYIVADIHYRLTGPRAEECERCMEWLAADIIAARPDVFVVAGDLFDRHATSAEERRMQEWLRELSASINGAPIILLAGNHDDPDQLWVLGASDAHGPILPFTSPGTRVVCGVLVHLLPWPRMAHLATVLPDASIVERRIQARAGLVDVLRGFRPSSADVPSLLVAHANVMGASLDSGQPVCGGEEIAVSVADLMEAQPGAVTLGHIHARQGLDAPVLCHYVGSLYRCTFGESAGSKGAMLCEWDGARWTGVERNGPARRMVLLEGRMVDGVLLGPEHENLNDAEVRLRIEFPGEERESARSQAIDWRARIIEAGAHFVMIEERPILVQRTRCAEIQTARTIAAKLVEWAKATGVDVPEGSMVKLATIEEEVGL